MAGQEGVGDARPAVTGTCDSFRQAVEAGTPFVSIVRTAWTDPSRPESCRWIFGRIWQLTDSTTFVVKHPDCSAEVNSENAREMLIATWR